MEPTGHYWFNFAQHHKDHSIKLVLVNPFHVKRSKELDDNNPTKNDRKDPKTIAMLVIRMLKPVDITNFRYEVGFNDHANTIYFENFINSWNLKYQFMGRQDEGIKGKLTLRDMGGLPPENMWIQRPEYEKNYEGLVELLIIIQLYTQMNVLSR